MEKKPKKQKNRIEAKGNLEQINNKTAVINERK